jgi:anti-sigma-K factor RskA
VAIESKRRRRVVPWLAAAMAAVVIGGVALWLVTRGPNAPSSIEDRAALIASGAIRIDWKATPDAPNASGDVVWSPTSQRGYMRFAGLPANDPTKTQYQLWIFDKTRDQAFPVDGGVFDVTSTGEVIVPIAAKLHVDDATLFAVTVERPGGVVVSKREHIVVTAARS